jgi:arginyl-tRNA synthetase
MGEVVSMLEQKGLLKDSEGAKIVDLSERGLQPCIIIKSDGATIYATRDLAAAIYRKREYDFHKSLYVVGIPQTLHFRQVFAILELLGFEWARDCEHIGFGQVRFPDRQMATREGEVIFLDDVMNEAVRRAAQMMDKERGVDEPEKVAESVGIGALVFTFLKNSRERDIIFSWDEMLDLEGDSGPYLQYTHARASSVLRKAGGAPGGADCSLLAEPEEYELICLMNGFAEAVAEAAQKCEPSLLARHVAAIARAFNKFYHYHKILDAPPGIREARLSACAAARALIGTGLALLGIAAPERM